MLNKSSTEGRQIAQAPKAWSIDKDFPIIIDKMVETGILLSACISTGDLNQISRCETLAKEVSAHEKTLTRNLLSSKEGDLPSELIHLPFLLQRVCENLENILDCCRVRTENKILLNRNADAHLQQFLAIVIDMMNNLRDAFTTPDAVLVESIVSEGSELNRMLREFRSTHLARSKTGSSAFQATAVCLDILDAIKSANEDVGNICQSLLGLTKITEASTKNSDEIDARKNQ